MRFDILRNESGREVCRVVTPSGVVGFIATEVPDEALTKFIRKLTRKIREGERRRARRVLAGGDVRRQASPQG